MKIYLKVFIISFLPVSLEVVWAQTFSKINAQLPSSFLIGEYEEAYDEILEKYPKNLVTLCDNDNDRAYSIWTLVMIDLAEYAKNNNVEINGLKAWMNIFFNNSGGIDYIVYYPKPNSKNLDFEKLSALFSSFCKSYKMKFTLQDRCMLNAAASFPVFVKN